MHLSDLCLQLGVPHETLNGKGNQQSGASQQKHHLTG